jgi:hypothetical protein
MDRKNVGRELVRVNGRGCFMVRVRNRESQRGEIAICVCDIAAILREIFAHVEAVGKPAHRRGLGFVAGTK